MTDYALRVPLEETEEAIAVAERVGAYDDTRSVTRRGGKTEVPVTRPVEGYDVVKQDETVARRRCLDDLVRDDVDAPSSWRIVGDVALVDLDGRTAKEKREIGEALLELHACDTVLEDRGVEGVTRRPDVGFVAGERDTRTVHRENGFVFELDPAEVMFSVGNSRERVRMRDTVGDETVFDMFAGIGYFSVPMGVGGADVVAAEINPTAYAYLRRNVERNGVEERVRAVNRDCRDVSVDADRVVMGHFESLDYVGHALDCLDEGCLHVHDAVHESDVGETRRRLVAEAESREREVTESCTRRVKSYSEGVYHVVVNARVV